MVLIMLWLCTLQNRAHSDNAAPMTTEKVLNIKGVSRDLPFKLGPQDEKERIRFIKIRESYYKEVLSTIF